MAKAEEGVCVLCGQEKKGAPAQADFVISSARGIRALLKMPAKHSVACRDCLGVCRERRERFEKNRTGYRLFAAVFVIFLVGGSLSYGVLEIRTVAAGILGALFLLLLPYAAYFPKFGQS